MATVEPIALLAAVPFLSPSPPLPVFVSAHFSAPAGEGPSPSAANSASGEPRGSKPPPPPPPLKEPGA
jgi:hypothetical protein